VRLTASHPAGLESLHEVAPQMSLKIAALHNEGGVLNIDWKSPPGRYELQTAESLWPSDPVNHFLCGAELELESDGPNPFAKNGHKVNGKKLVRRI
jgi:hypothetical protein